MNVCREENRDIQLEWVMEHSSGMMFIDSQNYAEYLCQLRGAAVVGLWHKKKKKIWKNWKYDMAQIMSINRGDGRGRISRVHLRDWFCGRTSVVFRRYVENTSIDGHAHTSSRHTDGSVYACGYAWETDADIRRRACRCKTGFDIPCLCNYARPVSGRTLIELRCIMIITFDTAMLDAFRIN